MSEVLGTVAVERIVDGLIIAILLFVTYLFALAPGGQAYPPMLAVSAWLALLGFGRKDRGDFTLFQGSLLLRIAVIAFTIFFRVGIGGVELASNGPHGNRTGNAVPAYPCADSDALNLFPGKGIDVHVVFGIDLAFSR
jgi:hypothetical protein